MFGITIQRPGSGVPAGIISEFGGVSAPTGWLMCDGSVVSQVTYAALFAVVGSMYDTGGEGGGNFRLPNLLGKYAVGKPSGGTLGGGAGAALTDEENRAVGQHNHSITYNTPAHVNVSGGNRVTVGNSATGGTPGLGTSNAGSVAGTNAPYVQLNFVIKI